MKFNKLLEVQPIPARAKDPLESDPVVQKLSREVLSLEQQLMQKKAELNSTRARVAQTLARKQSMKAATLD